MVQGGEAGGTGKGPVEDAGAGAEGAVEGRGFGAEEDDLMDGGHGGEVAG